MENIDELFRRADYDGAIHEAKYQSKNIFEAMGNRLIEAVGSPLVNGTARELGRRVYIIIGGIGAMRQKAVWRDIYEADQNEAEEIRKKADELQAMVDAFCNRTRIDAGVARHKAESIARKFATIVADFANDKLMFSGVDGKPSAKMPETADARLSLLFKHYFDKEPDYTHKSLIVREERYPGPYWNFVRAASEIAKIPLSEEAIRSARKRTPDKS
jgi:hypothetical protein